MFKGHPYIHYTHSVFIAYDAAVLCAAVIKWSWPNALCTCIGCMCITACTVVQAVVKATSQSNGKGQILTPRGSETPERISMKLGIYNLVAGMTTHANPCGAATTWVDWANT